MLKGAGLYSLDPKPAHSSETANKSENSCQIQAETLWWVGDEDCDKTQVTVRKKPIFCTGN